MLAVEFFLFCFLKKEHAYRSFMYNEREREMDGWMNAPKKTAKPLEAHD